MELLSANVTAQERYIGRDTVEVVDGKTLKIKTSPHGDKLLEHEFPAGTWVVTIAITAVKQ